MSAAEVHDRGPIRVLLAVNSRIRSQMLTETLRRDPSLQIMGSALNSREFLKAAHHHKPDIVILGAHLDDNPAGGIATLRTLREARPEICSILLVASPKREIVLEAFRAGARGIFSEHEALETLGKCVRVVFEGQVWATSSEVRIALEALSSTRTMRAVSAGGMNLLTPRELEVVALLSEGLTNREIGVQLGLSRHTIKNYLLKIFDKLGVSNRVELLFLTLTHPVTASRTSGESESVKKA
jgi:two-component system nitrate/nitrite response regulator NarL